jgi:hypothetical protein
MGSMVDVECGPFALWDFVSRVETYVRHEDRLEETDTFRVVSEARGNKRSDLEGFTAQVRLDARQAAQT